jgi:hypothetical protein
MTYRAYLRAPDQRVSDKTTTSDPQLALAAFGKLLDRTDLDGTPMLAVLNRNGDRVAHHRFDGKDPQKYWRGKLNEVSL